MSVSRHSVLEVELVAVVIVVVAVLLGLLLHLLGKCMSVGVDSDDIVKVGLLVGAADGILGLDNVGTKTKDDGGTLDLTAIDGGELVVRNAPDESHAKVLKIGTLLLFRLIVVLLLLVLEATGGAHYLPGGASDLLRGRDIEGLPGGTLGEGDAGKGY